MSRIRADKLVNRAGTGGPKFPNGVADGFSVTGIVTATSFSGPVTGNVTGNADTATSATTATVATNAQGITGTPNITVGTITGTDATLSGNLTVNGTTTTIDTAVTAVDSLAVDGNITAGGDVNIADKIVHTGDTATAIRFPAEGTFTVETGGSESIRINSSGRLLLGTTTEGEPNADNLTVADSGNCGITIRSGSSSFGAIYFSDTTSGGGEYDGYIDYNHSNSNLRFGTGATTRLTIDSTGDLIQASNTSFWQKNGNTRLLISSGASTPTVYVSDSGNDSTGDGTTSNPFRTITKAWEYIPRVYSFNHSPRILIKGTSYTIDTGHYCRGGGSGGNWQYGPAVDIKSESGSQIDVYLRSTLNFQSVDGLRFQNINFICDASGGNLIFYNCHRCQIYTSCDMNVTATGGWSYRIEYSHCKAFRDEMDVTVASTASSGLGAILVLNNSSLDGTRSITKTGAQFGQAAVAVVNNSILTGQWNVNNFNTGIRLGINHYGAETGGSAMLNGVTISNCNKGLDLYNNSYVRKYSATYTGTTTNETSQTGSFIN